MSKDEITLSVQKRDVLGKQVKELRRQGKVPAVIHERGKDSVHVLIEAADLKKAFSSAGKHSAIKVDVDGKNYTTIVKDVMNEPASSNIYHAVFQAIKEDELVTAEIPIKIVGEIPAERANLLVLKNLEILNVEALPKDLIDVVEVDGSSLVDVSDKLHVSEVKLPDTITIKTEPETVIASVEMPKDQVAEADAALEEMKEQDETDVESEQGAEGEAGESDEPGSEETKTSDDDKSKDKEEPKKESTDSKEN